MHDIFVNPKFIVYAWLKISERIEGQKQVFFIATVCGLNFACLEIDKIYNMNRHISFFDTMNFAGFNYYHTVVWIT